MQIDSKVFFENKVNVYFKFLFPFELFAFGFS